MDVADSVQHGDDLLSSISSVSQTLWFEFEIVQEFAEILVSGFVSQILSMNDETLRRLERMRQDDGLNHCVPQISIRRRRYELSKLRTS